jgi:hypothetical protein
MVEVKQWFQKWYANQELYSHVKQVQRLLNESHSSAPVSLPACELILYLLQERMIDACFSKDSFSTPPSQNSRRIVSSPSISLRELFKARDPPTHSAANSSHVLGLTDKELIRETRNTGSAGLDSILSEFKGNNSKFQQTYAKDVTASLESLKSEVPFIAPASELPYTMDQLYLHRNQCRDVLSGLFSTIVRSLSPRTLPETVRSVSGHWPRVTHRSLLRELAFTSGSCITDHWKWILLSFAQALVIYQRSRRLVKFALRGNAHEFFVELKNDHWDYSDLMQNTDWILIQVRIL